MDQCEICCARVRELRRGRCWGCYTRWVDARPVGLGAVCRFCGERRRAWLKSVELFGSWSPVCHSCAGRIAATQDLPQSVAGIRAMLGRERRSVIRRVGRAEGRAFPHERRAGERRADEILIEIDTSGGMDAIDDEMVVEIAELAQDLEALAAELPEAADLTCIRERP
jgi:hypothetical protein